MNNRFFFITTYDDSSASMIAAILNEHQEIHCSHTITDPFLQVIDLEKINTRAKNVDQLIQTLSNPQRKFNGNIHQFSAFELQHKILVEKTSTPVFRAHIALSPKLRINLLIKSWLKGCDDIEKKVSHIRQTISELMKQNHHLFQLYIFHYFHGHILNSARQEGLDINDANNQLFILALAKTVAYDTADLPLANKTFCFEQLVENKNYFWNFLNHLTGNKINLDEEFELKRNEKSAIINNEIASVKNTPWQYWQEELLKKYLSIRLQTIHYPHIDKPLSDFYSELGYELTGRTSFHPLCSKLISIQLNSNRPSQLANYFDNLEETADHPEEIEVLVNIDINDKALEKLLMQEQQERKFTLKYITSPKPNSFCDLWQPINKLWEISDPNSYFMLNISDEMLFTTKGWDTILKKYVGFFPDHIFRLRASRNKFRNYFDRWECSFGQDSIPITTRKWIAIGGDWNPCFGPDSFQQLIAFYLAKEGAFSSTNYLREFPILDIKFYGDVPSVGMQPGKVWKHTSDHLRAMQVCQSYKMQLEARRRAILLKAHILASASQLTNFAVKDCPAKKQIHLINLDKNKISHKLTYKLNWLSIFAVNQWRKLRFNAYFGGGKEYNKPLIISFAGYLKAKHYPFKILYEKLVIFYKLPKKMLKLISLKLYKHILKSCIDRISSKQTDLRSLKHSYDELKNSYQIVCLENQKLQNEISELKANSNIVLNHERKETYHGIFNQAKH